MSEVSSWNAIDDSNNATPPDGWPEGMMPSGVNNTARMMMGALRREHDRVVAQVGSVAGEITTANLTATNLTTTSLTTTSLTTTNLTATDITTANITASGGITGFHIVSTGNINADSGTIYGYNFNAAHSINTTDAYIGGIQLSNVSGSLHIPSSMDVAATITGSDIIATSNGYKPGGGMWSATSDIRTKRDVAAYTAGLAEIMLLRPVKYFHNGRGETRDDGRQFVGLVADDVRSVMPDMVGTAQCFLDPGDEKTTELLTLDATPLIYGLVNAVQQLAAKVAALEKALIR